MLHCRFYEWNLLNGFTRDEYEMNGVNQRVIIGLIGKFYCTPDGSGKS